MDRHVGFEFVATLVGSDPDVKALSEAFDDGEHTVTVTPEGVYELRSSSFSRPSKREEDVFWHEALSIARLEADALLQRMAGLVWCVRPNDFRGLITIGGLKLLLDGVVVDRLEIINATEALFITPIPRGLASVLQRRLSRIIADPHLGNAVAMMAGPSRGWNQMYTAFEFMGGRDAAARFGLGKRADAFSHNANTTRSVAGGARHGMSKNGSVAPPKFPWDPIEAHCFIAEMIEMAFRDLMKEQSEVQGKP